MDRRGIVSIAALAVLVRPALAADDVDGGKLAYRGFTVDVSTFQYDPNFVAIENSLKHQIDIAADCGAESKIIDFFRGRRISLRIISGDEPGQWGPERGIEIDATPQSPEKPILLHELLHAFHALALPGGFQNPDILKYYSNAVRGQLYPPANQGDKYVLKNALEFFAVTGSLYLWGFVDRQPHSRANLRASQPAYYAWLGQQFGVQK